VTYLEDRERYLARLERGRAWESRHPRLTLLRECAKDAAVSVAVLGGVAVVVLAAASNVAYFASL
jgi:hypothetical protein